MTRDPRCSATVRVPGRGTHRCQFAGTRQLDGAWFCDPHYRAARHAAEASDQPTASKLSRLAADEE